MANKKFSEFTLKTDSANVDFLVGFEGTDNVRIAPSNLGGGGASDLNGLSDVSVDLTNDSAYFINIPSGLSGATGNLIIGENAGNALTSQDNVIAIGSNALSANNNALTENAIFIGKDTGKNMTANVSNSTVIGTYAAENANDLSNGAVILGYRALRYGGATFSVYIGTNAAANNTSQWGYSSVGIGNSVLLNSVTNSSVVIGQNAQDNGNANKTVVLGYEGARTVSSDGHISVGWRAGYSQTSGASNTNVGYEAGYSNTTGGYRTMLGYQAGKSQTGGNNTFLGSLSGGSRSGSGTSNTGVGANALRYVENSNNTALGNAAGQYADSTSTKNVMIGNDAMGGAFGAKSENVAIGYQAGTAVTTGGRLVIIGSEAGNTLTTSIRTVIIGHDAGKSITTNGWDSVHIGDAAGQNVTGQKNTSVGKDAMLKASGTSDNSECTAIGQRALRALRTGNQNTALGASAGDEMQTGSNSTMIGYHAQASSTSASNEITLGDSNIATLRCAVTSITSLSDERDKSEIKDLQYGLDFINSLQPREFIWNNRAETRTNTDIDGNETEVEFYSANKGKKDFGFIAQEVQSVDDDTLRLVYDENPDKLEMSYGKLVPVLVQAIKELKAEVELLKA